MEKLAYDRVGYGTTAFNAITVNVENGVVTLGGHAYSDVTSDRYGMVGQHETTEDLGSTNSGFTMRTGLAALHPTSLQI